MNEMIRLRIAASKFYKNFDNITIKDVSSGFPCDLIVESKNSSLKFGIEVTGSAPLRTKAFEHYINDLSRINFSDIQIPIIIAAVNEETEEVRVAPLLSVRLSTIRLYRNPSFQLLTEKTRDIIWDNISAMDKVIRMLNNSNLGVVKAINISIKREDQFTLKAITYYLRTFSDNYKMQSKEIVDEKTRFERILNGIPQNEYPEDILDCIIQRGLAQAYPTADIECNSSLLLFNTELDNLKRTIQTYGTKHDFIIQVEPNIDQLVANGVQMFTSYPIKIHIYPENRYTHNQWYDVSQIVTLEEDEWQLWNSVVPNILSTKRDISDIII